MASQKGDWSRSSVATGSHVGQVTIKDDSHTSINEVSSDIFQDKVGPLKTSTKYQAVITYFLVPHFSDCFFFFAKTFLNAINVCYFMQKF